MAEFTIKLSDESLTVYATVMQAVFEGYKKGTGKIFRDSINLVSAQAEKNFAARIERDATSATLGGRTYRRRSRVTGRFTFGVGKTFTGSILKNLGPTTQGFGYPIVARADSRTKRVWRGLEFGWDSMRMPKGQWRDSDGKRVRSDTFRTILGGDTFEPTGPIADEVAGIQAKLFISDAFDFIVEGFTDPALRKLAVDVAKAAEKVEKK